MEYESFTTWLAQQNSGVLTLLATVAKVTKFRTAQELADYVGEEHPDLVRTLYVAYHGWQLYALNTHMENIKGIMHPSQSTLNWLVRKDSTSLTFFVLPVSHQTPEKNVALLFSNEAIKDEEILRMTFELLITSNPELRELAPIMKMLTVFMNKGEVVYGEIFNPEGDFQFANNPESPPFYTQGLQVKLQTESEFFDSTNKAVLLAFNGHQFSEEFETGKPRKLSIQHTSIKFKNEQYQYLATAINRVVEVINYCLSGAKGVNPRVFIEHPIRVIDNETRKEVWNSSVLNF